jgi:hypothetical protein
MAHASPHLAALGDRARPAGGAAAADARRHCAGVLGDLGFVITEQKFEYSKFPGAWATPLAGILIPALLTALAVARTPGAIVVCVIAFDAVVFVAVYMAQAGVLGVRWMRRRGINLEAVRGGGEPKIWLVAHLDSKWQPVSMIARVAGVLGTVIGVLAVVGVLLVTAFVGRVAAGWMTAALAVAWISAVPLMLSVVGARNAGSLDNASGVAAVLDAAALVPPEFALGVLITDAEELGLAGARAWARSRADVGQRGIALNCDSIDDDGPLVVMYTKSPPHRLLDAFTDAARRAGERLRVLRLIPGILTDSVALADAGWRTVTLSRGTVRTLMRIHTSRDTLAHMDGRGIAGAARVLAIVAAALAPVALEPEERL